MVKSKGIPPNPLSSGLGMMIICPDESVFLSSLNILVLLCDVSLSSWQSDPPSRMIWIRPRVCVIRYEINDQDSIQSTWLIYIYTHTNWISTIGPHFFALIVCNSSDNTWWISLPRRFPLKEFLLLLQDPGCWIYFESDIYPGW